MANEIVILSSNKTQLKTVIVFIWIPLEIHLFKRKSSMHSF